VSVCAHVLQVSHESAGRCPISSAGVTPTDDPQPPGRRKRRWRRLGLWTLALLVAGFAVLAASPFSPTVTTGSLMSITLSFALVVDFLLLPPLLLAVVRKQ